MKATKITFWISTTILALMMIYSAWMYFTNPLIDQTFQHLGFPAYFRIELAVAKLIGAVLLFAPVGTRIKEWVYAGFGICFISAFIAHTASGDLVIAQVMPLIFLGLLIISYMSGNKLKDTINTIGKHAIN